MVARLISQADITTALGWTGKASGRGASLVVASSDAPAHIKAQADYVHAGVYNKHQETINAAIAALPTEGGEILLAGRNFYTDGEVLIDRDNVRLRMLGVSGLPSGSPASGTIPALAASPRIIMAGTGFTGSYLIRCAHPSGERCLHGIEIDGLGLMGTNYSGGLATVVGGIFWQVIRGAIRHCFIQFTRGHAVYSTALRIPAYMPDGFPAGLQAPFDGFFLHNHIRNGALDGFFFDDTSTDHIITGNIIEIMGGCGIRNGSTYPSTANQMHQNYIYNCLDGGIRMDAWHNRVHNNRVQDCNGGVYVTGNYGGGFEIVGNLLRNTSYGADNTYDAINIVTTGSAGNIRGGLIAANVFSTGPGLFDLGPVGAKYRPRYGVNITHASMTDLDVVGNAESYESAASCFGTGFINDLGTGTEIIGNGKLQLRNRPTVSGSRGGNAALADLLTELATLGIITDSTTA